MTTATTSTPLAHLVADIVAVADATLDMLDADELAAWEAGADPAADHAHRLRGTIMNQLADLAEAIAPDRDAILDAATPLAHIDRDRLDELLAA